MSVTVIIPALNEAATIGVVVAAVPPTVTEVLVVDNGSTDGTGDVAATAGATVLREARRGYGAACLAGSHAARGDILVYMDADGSFDPGEIERLVEPMRRDACDLALGSREMGAIAPGAMPFHQRFGNALAVRLLRALYRLPVTDLGPFRAIRRSRLLDLHMSEMTYGWPIEMMVKAARLGYRVAEVPVTYRPRAGGTSKVSGTVRGSVLAGYHILRTVWRHARYSRAGAGAGELGA